MSYLQRFVKDEDGHWYLIPAGAMTDFNNWVDHTMSDNFTEEWPTDYNNYAIDYDPSDYVVVVIKGDD